MTEETKTLTFPEELQKIEGLSIGDEYIEKIAELVTGRENKAINMAFSHNYKLTDDTVLEKTGIRRNGAEKNYDYVARVLDEQNKEIAKYKESEAKLKQLELSLEDKKSETTPDGETDSKITQLTKDFNKVARENEELLVKLNSKDEEFSQKLAEVHFDGLVKSSIAGLKGKAHVEMAEKAKETLYAAAINEIKSLKRVVDPNTGEITFRNGEGETLLNAKNAHKPFTVDELITEQLTEYGLFAMDAPKGGLGGKAVMPKNSAGEVAFTSKGEAYVYISRELAAKGVAKTDGDYQKQYKELIVKYGVDSIK